MSIGRIQKWACPRRILLATNLTDSKFTLPVAIQHAKAYKAELRIAHILPDPNASLIDPVLMVNADSDRVTEAAEKTIEEALNTVKNDGIRCSSRLIAGDVAGEIVKIAREWKADRLIAGSVTSMLHAVIASRLPIPEVVSRRKIEHGFISLSLPPKGNEERASDYG